MGRSRHREFRKLFNMPEDETLIEGKHLDMGIELLSTVVDLAYRLQLCHSSRNYLSGSTLRFEELCLVPYQSIERNEGMCVVCV
jgi:hypothetical protein